MEILQNGKKVTKKKRWFYCEACGCVFEAEQGEYRGANFTEWFDHKITAKCECPCCGETVYSRD